MDGNINKIKERLELALRPAEPPTLEEALEQVSRRGVLRGPVDWVFPAWMLYVEYATQEIIKTFPLSEEEKRQLFHFRDNVKQFLQKTWIQTKEKLIIIYNALVENRYRAENKRTRIVVGDDTIHIYNQMYILIPKLSASDFVTTKFPPILNQDNKTLRELQIGWIASDEGRNHTKPRMGTSQPWQLYAWAATRPGKLTIWINHVGIVKSGISIGVVAQAEDWDEYLDRISALAYVINEFKKGNWTPFTTAWLGDGGIVWGDIRRGSYRIRLAISQKVARKLRFKANRNLALLASGRQSYFKLWSAFPDDYRRLLICLNSHKMRFLETIISDEKRNEYIKENDFKRIEICGVELRIRIDLRDNIITLHKNSANITILEEIKRRLEECGIEAKIYFKKSSYTHLLVVKLNEQIVQKHPNIRKKIIQYLETLPKNKKIHLLKKYPFLDTYLIVSSFASRDKTHLQQKLAQRVSVAEGRRQMA